MWSSCPRDDHIHSQSDAPPVIFDNSFATVHATRAPVDFAAASTILIPGPT